MRRVQLRSKLTGALLLLYCAFNFLCAQEVEPEKLSRNKLAFMMAFGIIPEHSEQDEATSNYLFVVPAFGVNYDFLITEKFGIGLHTDVILQKFEVEELKDDIRVQRLFPVTINVMGSFRPNESWTFLAGGGAELEKNKSFPMFALGVDYGMELRETWEVSFNFMFEHRLQAYNSYLLGVGFTKTFRSK